VKAIFKFKNNKFKNGMSDIPPINIQDLFVPSYITEIQDKESNDLLDGFYARLLINTPGLYDYVKSHDASGAHAPTASSVNTLHGMNRYSIYQLVEYIRASERTDDVLVHLRNCYAQTGFLVFTNDWKTVFVYSEDNTTWKKWLEMAQLDGPSSWEIYNEFANFA
jgi:hypothetical protein